MLSISIYTDWRSTTPLETVLHNRTYRLTVDQKSHSIKLKTVQLLLQVVVFINQKVFLNTVISKNRYHTLLEQEQFL